MCRKKKKILIVSTHMDIGGVERSLIGLLEVFDYEKYEVDLFLFNHTGELMEQLPPECNLLPEIPRYTTVCKGIKQSFKEGHILIALGRILSQQDIKYFKKRYKYGAESGCLYLQKAQDYTFFAMPKIKGVYDAAISFQWPHNCVERKVRAKTKIAWIHTDYRTSFVDKRRELKQWSSFQKIVAVSQSAADAFAEEHPSLADRVTVIENILSPSFVRAQVQKFPPDEMPKTKGVINLLSVGRLCYAKGFDVAVASCRKLLDDGYKVKWYIIGYGADEAKLRRLIGEHGLEESFILLGKKINPYPFIKHCDIVVQPSRYEGKSVSIREAQMLYKPVVITNFPTAASQMEHGIDGHICGMGAENVALAIAHMIDNPLYRARLSDNLKTRDYGNQREVQKLYTLIG